ncbi:MAG: hypothetical protein ACKPKO_37980, partial [Candidatus Fonsibacter sp.]
VMAEAKRRSLLQWCLQPENPQPYDKQRKICPWRPHVVDPLTQGGAAGSASIRNRNLRSHGMESNGSGDRQCLAVAKTVVKSLCRP